MLEEQSVKLDSAIFTFTQDGDCLDEIDHYQTLTIELTSDLGIDNTNGAFIILKTERWAINELSDLEVLINRCKQVIKKP